MKALKSKLAAELLSDPKGKEQLRSYLVNKNSGQTVARNAAAGRFIDVRSKSEGRLVRIKPVVVPKAG